MHLHVNSKESLLKDNKYFIKNECAIPWDLGLFTSSNRRPSGLDWIGSGNHWAAFGEVPEWPPDEPDHSGGAFQVIFVYFMGEKYFMIGWKWERVKELLCFESLFELCAPALFLSEGSLRIQGPKLLICTPHICFWPESGASWVLAALWGPKDRAPSTSRWTSRWLWARWARPGEESRIWGLSVLLIFSTALPWRPWEHFSVLKPHSREHWGELRVRCVDPTAAAALGGKICWIWSFGVRRYHFFWVVLTPEGNRLLHWRSSNLSFVCWIVWWLRWVKTEGLCWSWRLFLRLSFCRFSRWRGWCRWHRWWPRSSLRRRELCRSWCWGRRRWSFQASMGNSGTWRGPFPPIDIGSSLWGQW